MPLRIVFMGTPDFAVPTLMEILSAGHEVVAVYSQPPRAAGRGLEPRRSPVHAYAESSGIPVHTPTTLKSPVEQETFRQHRADVGVVVAYGLLLPKPILEAPVAGCLNLHASALPRWRGAAPIQRAIMAGDRETAVMVMRMDEGLDTGPICLAEHVPIGPNTTAGELHDELARIGASLMVRALAALERGSLEAVPQPEEGVTYAAKIRNEETRIDFSRDATAVHNQIRGLSPHPGAWFDAGPQHGHERIKVLRSELAMGEGAPGEVLDDALLVACGRGAVRLLELQRPGKKPMPAEAFLRGFRIARGERLG
jgi:methionyl-tRNA formyltransferase